MRLKDKIAIVTGGGSGIGRAIAMAYAREGAIVVIADIHAANGQAVVDEIKAAGGQAAAMRTDVGEPRDIDALAAATVEAHGRIDIMVNVAGILNTQPVLDCTVEQWDRTLNVNLRGTFLGMQAAARVMVRQGHGVILNTSSILGQHARATRAAYGASKAGISMITRTAAIELGPHGIRVNAIAPGSIETPLARLSHSSPEEVARKAAAIPLRRRGTPEDLAGPAVFLASDEAAYVSGEVFTIDGAMTAGIP